jgi:hypothetical protein
MSKYDYITYILSLLAIMLAILAISISLSK